MKRIFIIAAMVLGIMCSAFAETVTISEPDAQFQGVYTMIASSDDNGVTWQKQHQFVGQFEKKSMTIRDKTFPYAFVTRKMYNGYPSNVLYISYNTFIVISLIDPQNDFYLIQGIQGGEQFFLAKCYK